MGGVRKIPLVQIPKAERALAERINRSETTGDPDVQTLSSVEVQRAWNEASSWSPKDRTALAHLSAQLQVEVPAWAAANHKRPPVEEVLGPARVDEGTGQIVRRTRMVCTLGPACNDVDILTKMIDAGMDVARFNFSHIRDLDTAKSLKANLVEAMQRAGRPVKILADLQGPKTRLGPMAEPRMLKAGETISLGAADALGKGGIPIEPTSLLADLRVGQRMFINDGKVELRIAKVDDGKVQAEVVRGGQVKARKGLNVPDTRLTERVPTEADLHSIDIIKAIGVDLVAVSFVEEAADIERVRAALGDDSETRAVKLMAKVERPAALDQLEGIYEASDAIMVARGDLAVELGDAEVPVAQARMHNLGNRMDVPTGTATEMLASMTDGSGPSRAEASDVYLSVVEGAEFIMTSGETAVGEDPVGVVEMMSHLASTAERALRTGTVSAR